VSTAILLSCHGTISDLDDLPAFLAKIRRGREVSPELIAEVRRRFEAIGGSPLMRITGEQAAALEKRLGLPVRVAARLWHPSPTEAVTELVASGVDQLVSLPLAPQSVDVYHAEVRAAARAHPSLTLRCVPGYGLEPALIDAFIETLDEVLPRFGSIDPANVAVVLTAHSLPQRVIDAGDRYEAEFRDMATVVAARLKARGYKTTIAFQSQGFGREPWLGPDLGASFEELARAGFRHLVVAPIGFVAEHVETLFDLDIEARELARRAGFTQMERAQTVCTRPRFIDALEHLVRRELRALA
jgi:ferrochelatase